MILDEHSNEAPCLEGVAKGGLDLQGRIKFSIAEQVFPLSLVFLFSVGNQGHQRRQENAHACSWCVYLPPL